MKTNNWRLNILMQVIVWLAIFLSPMVYLGMDQALSVSTFFRCLALPVCLFISYFANYLCFVPRYLFQGRQRTYFLLNTAMVMVLTLLVSVWVKWSGSPFSFAHLLPTAVAYEEQNTGTHIVQTLHVVFNLCVSVGIATLVRMSLRWVDTKHSHAAAAMAQREAELENLRYQVNPHFLLNTLNNIYALTAFDQRQAQSAIMELSKMLQHILYEHDHYHIDIKKEASFLHNYVNLMKLRLPSDVEIIEDIDVPSSQTVHIAPMLLISLVENAFKHGISPTQKSFIHIHLHADNERITCEIVNSNHPKTASDKSGSGIGLQQVQRRLDLLYPGQYVWEKGPNSDQSIYSSKITLYDTQLHDY